MNKHKLILLVFFLFSIGFLFAQEKNFEEEIEHTEKQIQLLQASIKKNNEEIQKVTSQEKTTWLCEFIGAIVMGPGDCGYAEHQRVVDRLVLFTSLVLIWFVALSIGNDALYILAETVGYC